MEREKEIAPCDQILLPVYLTFRTDKGVKASREMFEKHGICVLRWYDDGKMHQTMVRNPRKWYGGANYYNETERAWKY